MAEKKQKMTGRRVGGQWVHEVEGADESHEARDKEKFGAGAPSLADAARREAEKRKKMAKPEPSPKPSPSASPSPAPDVKVGSIADQADAIENRKFSKFGRAKGKKRGGVFGDKSSDSDYA